MMKRGQTNLVARPFHITVNQFKQLCQMTRVQSENMSNKICKWHFKVGLYQKSYRSIFKFNSISRLFWYFF